MRDDAQERATEFVKDLYVVGEIDAERLDTGVAGVLARPLEIHSGMGRLRLAGWWQVAAETHISADLGSIRLDLTEADLDDHVIDLHVYSGCGTITIIVPRGVGVQVIWHRGGVSSRLVPPVPGLPLIRLDVTTNIGRVRLRHPPKS